MRLHYQRANPDTGGESFLLRFEGVRQDRIACLLVNSGHGVRMERLLDESRGEYLMGIVINNAHPEYYCTLEQNAREETPIYATPETAQIMATAITRSTDQQASILDQLVGVDGWHQLVEGLGIHPVPVGHAPGAAGFLFEITDGERHHTLLVADEYTTRHAGGYAGVTLDLDIGIDSTVITDAVDHPVAPALTEACSIICERAAAGSTVLVTADEPTGLHVASLLGRLGTQFDTPRSIVTTGKIAALWEQFGYSIPSVTARPESTPVLDPGTVVVSTPATPVEGMSGRLFEELADDPDGAVVRLTHGQDTPMPAAQCTVQSLPWHNFPTRNTRDTVIDAFDPVQVVLADRNTPVNEDISPDCDSFLWRVDDDLVYTLFDGEQWVAPAEIDPDTEHQIRSQTTNKGDTPRVSEHGLAVPPCRSDCDVAAEGIDDEAIYDRLRTTDEQSNRSTTAPTNGSVTESSATDGGTASIGGALTALGEQLSVVKSIVNDRTHRARVVDAGGDVCLFRVQDPPASFEHGQTVTLLLYPDENRQQDGKEDTETPQSTNGTS